MNRKTFFGILFFPVLFMFMEAMLHLDTFESIDTGLLLAILFAVPYGLLAYVLTSFKNRIADRILLILITLITVLYFSLQTVYHKIFRVFVSFYSVLQNTGDVAEFWKEAVHGIISSIPMLMLDGFPLNSGHPDVSFRTYRNKPRRNRQLRAQAFPEIRSARESFRRYCCRIRKKQPRKQ